MARIGVLEIKARNHELSGLCKISKTTRNEVTAFTTRAIFPHVEEELRGKIGDYEWVLNEENESPSAYLKRIEKICTSRIDLLIINTLRDWQFLFFRPECKVLAFIDDLNHWFKDTSSFSSYLKKMAKHRELLLSLSLMINPLVGPIARRSIISRLDGVIVEYPPFKQYICDNFNYRGKVYFIPNRPFEDEPPLRVNGKVRFVAPGRIQEVRRDYRLLMRVFDRLFAKYRDKIGLDLIGEPIGEYGQEIISHCAGLAQEGFDVFYPTEYVPPRTVEEKMTRADVIVSPLQVIYRSGPIEETYTITKPTGIFSDTIKYARPCVVPDTYRVTDEMKTSFVQYRDENGLVDLLGELIENRERLEKFQEQAIVNSKKFSLEKLHIAFDNMVEELL